jgi:tetratricopeptide (TPR) repeat protein
MRTCALKKFFQKSFFFPVSLEVRKNSFALAAAGFILLPFLASACLTARSPKAPAYRSLTASEAGRLQSENDNAWEKRPAKPEKDDSPENNTEMAEIFLQNGDYEKSIYHYSKLLSQHPERHDVRYKMAVALLLSGQRQEAKQQLAEVLLHRMDLLEAHEALGVVYLQDNNLSAARQEFRSVLAREPSRFQSRYLLGETSVREKQYSQAVTEFNAALELAPGHARVLSGLGWANFKLKNYDQALLWLKKAQALNPADPKLHNRLGMVLAEQKKLPEALAAFKKAGDEAHAFNNIGVYYYLDRQYAEAARCFQKALESRPTFYQEAQVNLDKALARLQGDNFSAPGPPPDRQPQELSLNKK